MDSKMSLLGHSVAQNVERVQEEVSLVLKEAEQALAEARKGERCFWRANSKLTSDLT